MDAIVPGQVYVSWDGGRRIRIIGKPRSIPGTWGFGKVRVETVTDDGRGLRYRDIEMTSLHFSRFTKDGRLRQTGYILEEE
jgi:hypothetical protein